MYWLIIITALCFLFFLLIRFLRERSEAEKNEDKFTCLLHNSDKHKRGEITEKEALMLFQSFPWNETIHDKNRSVLDFKDHLHNWHLVITPETAEDITYFTVFFSGSSELERERVPEGRITAILENFFSRQDNKLRNLLTLDRIK